MRKDERRPADPSYIRHVLLLFLLVTTYSPTAAILLMNVNVPQVQPPRLLTASGVPVSRYALGGAARSSQPSTLPASYLNAVGPGAYLFYYNPHRYPAFMQGIKECCCEAAVLDRRDMFVSSGGGERSKNAMEERLADALAACDPGGGASVWLDMFVLEYVVPEELTEDPNDAARMVPGAELSEALAQAAEWKERRHADDAPAQVRYVAVSTHSHAVGEALAAHPAVDALMLRYNLAHRLAADGLSFPAAERAGKPVVAFTSTRWNALQKEPPLAQLNAPPTMGDCLSFALSAPAVDVVLHSARDEAELSEALGSMGFTGGGGAGAGGRDTSAAAVMSDEAVAKWRAYGDAVSGAMQERDDFDEYPEEEEAAAWAAAAYGRS